MKAKKNDWVKIHNIVLQPEERAPQVPDDTKRVPLEMWVKGFILNDALLNEVVKVKTITGRIVEGTLVEINPSHEHNFGKCIPEILQIGLQLKEILFGGEDHE